jgi:signal transduction histidine kinase
VMENSLKILIVDDDAVDRMAIERSLHKTDLQFELREAENSESAVHILESVAFDCVFLDYWLPDQDGLHLIKTLKRMGITVPLVVLTGQGDEQIAVDIMKAGASDYLSKSRISPERLARILRNVVRLHRAELSAMQANQKLRETNQQLLEQNKALAEQRAQIELQNIKLVEVSELKSQFLATISHELRTPMNAIMGFSQLLLQQYPDPLTPSQADMVERVFQNSQNLLEMLNEVLDFSKVESGHLMLNPEDFNIGHLVFLTVEELKALAIKKKIDVKVENRLENPLVFSDQECIRRILTNLVSNAVKFTDEGSVLISVASISQADQIVLSVQDTGIGIPAQSLSLIFEPFRQVDQTVTRQYSGTGLGLAITDSLVKAIGGTVNVESQIGVGSKFWVQFPRRLGHS